MLVKTKNAGNNVWQNKQIKSKFNFHLNIAKHFFISGNFPRESLKLHKSL